MECEIYYYKTSARILGLIGSLSLNLDADFLSKDYICVWRCNLDHGNDDESRDIKETLFALFNGEENPLQTAERQQFIVKNRLHTSMSLGDVIRIKEGSEMKTWMAWTYGFKPIE